MEGAGCSLGTFSSTVEGQPEPLTWGDSFRASSQRLAVEGAWELSGARGPLNLDSKSPKLYPYSYH